MTIMGSIYATVCYIVGHVALSCVTMIIVVVMSAIFLSKAATYLANRK